MIVVFDLDDTLYNEIDFVKSGFKEISRYLQDENYYYFMLETFEQEGSGKVFDTLIDYFNLKIDVKKLIEIYRFHIPTISLDTETLEVLSFTNNYKTALISDGHYIMQKNKYEVLGLKRFIQYPIFTDFYQTSKPHLKAFEMVMKYFGENNKFIYISDNPKKDFIAPQKLGWMTLRYRNTNGIYRNIKNSADFEVTEKIDIINYLKGL